MKNTSKAIITGVSLLALAGAATAQSPTRTAGKDARTSSIVPGERYRAGWLHRLILGAHHRELWLTPIEAPLLDLDTFAGGLTPVRRGGGLQTKSLRLRNRDGRTFVFRSLDKDPAQNLSPELRASIAARVLQDQISSLLPFATLAVEPLMEAADVLHATPVMTVMPDDARLGEFRAEFGGVLGMIEERPETNDGEGFAGAVEVISSERLEERLEANPSERVDAVAFLNARLLDVLIGDVDRHPDQWRWAGFAQHGGMIWRPIPRDRDFAFTRMDGLALLAVRYRHPQFVSFEADYPSLLRLTWSGRALDRRLLGELPRATWDSVAADLAASITDERIDVAVARLPVAYQAKIGGELRAALRARRDDLTAAADEYYRLLARHVDVHATDAAETVVVSRAADGAVEVRITWRSDAAGERTLFTRRFARAETDEVRIYAHGGDDRVIVADGGPTAGGRSGITVRVIGGGDDDVLIDSATVAGGTRFYDDRGTNSITTGRHTGVDTRRYRAPERVSHGAPPRDWGRLWMVAPGLSFNSDLGLYTGATVTRIGYGFRRTPYASKLALHAGYASAPQRLKAKLLAELPTSDPAVSVDVQLLASGAEFIRFYGFGNETVADGADAAFRVRSTEFSLDTRARLQRERLLLSAGAIARWIDSRGTAGSLFEAEQPYGYGRHREFGLVGGARYDARNRPANATRGFYALLDAAWYPSLLDVHSPFGTARLEAATYLTPIPALDATVAVRGIGQKVWGDAPFRDAAIIGGASTLRGFREQRFAGDAAVLGNAELRVKVADVFVLLPEQIGVHALADVGRVFTSGESSRQWHQAFGGGVWVSLVNPGTVLSITFARSKERSSIYIQNGFQF